MSDLICHICLVDRAVLSHHVIPGEKETVECCQDCGNQIHMLFTNKELANIGIDNLLNTEAMKKYTSWKKKHPGEHKYRASQKVRQYQKYHRG